MPRLTERAISIRECEALAEHRVRMVKDARLKRSTLPFEGMNQVIYLRRELSVS